MAEDGDTLTTIAQARFQDSQRYGRSDYSQHTDGAESDHGQRYTLVLKLAHTPAHTDAHATAREWHRRRPWDGRGTATTAAAACGMPATSAPGLCLTPTTCTGTGPRPAAMRCETLLVGATQLALAVVAQPAHREQRREAP